MHTDKNEMLNQLGEASVLANRTSQTPATHEDACPIRVYRCPSVVHLFDEAVAHTAHRVQMLRRRADFFAQPAHVRIHRARVNQAVVFPHVA